MQLSLTLFVCLSLCVAAIRLCSPAKRFTRFHKVRSCFKSGMPVMAWKDFRNVSDCMKFAREKSGLAFNFIPEELRNLTQNRWMRNCQVFGCPETDPGALAFDAAFEYYTAYADFNTTINSTCIKSVGLFSLIQDKMNHSSALDFCQKMSADLADVLSEFRTNALAALLESMASWYRAAYVGLDDVQVEGTFEAPLGNFMDCTRFRAWAVGHPRPNRRREDCVILDSDRTWRAIDCKIKMPFVCELYPSAPLVKVSEFKEENCTKIRNKRRRKQCLADNQLYELYMNSTRMDQCALSNDFD